MTVEQEQRERDARIAESLTGAVIHNRDEAFKALAFQHRHLIVAKLATPPTTDASERRREYRFGSPPEPVVNPNEAWIERYADWYHQGRG